VKSTKEEIIDVDFFLNGYELDCLFIVGWCVTKIGGVMWCELYHGGYKNSLLFGFY
jgi:hypothetical protein